VALFTVKPSRGTVAFFALLGAGLVARYAMNRRDESVVARDAPVTHATRRLLRCVLGRDAERMLWPRPPGDDPRPWANAINARLRLMVASDQGDGWPGRCSPIAQRLTVRLAGAQFTAAYSAALEAQRAIAEMSASSMGAITAAENGRLGVALATISLEVIKANVGTESGWTSALAYESADLVAPNVRDVPLGVSLPPSADGVTLAAPEWVLFQDANDRRAHSLLFRDRAAPADAVIGPGAPLRVGNNSTATLLATDDADALLPLESARPIPVELPLAARRGEHPIESWQSVKSANHRWFAYVSRGRLHVWSTPVVGATAWVERVPPSLQDVPVAGVALVAEPEPAEASATQPTPALPAPIDPAAPAAARDEWPIGLTAYVLRHGARGVSVERWSFAKPTDESAVAPANNPANAAARATPVAAREPVRRAVLESESRSSLRPRVLSCVSGTSAHFAVASDDSYAFYHIVNGASHSGDVPVARVGALSGGRFELSCDEQRSLLLVDALGRAGSMLVYQGEREPQILPVPLAALNVQRNVDAAALVPGAVLAFVRTPGSVRVLRSADASSWQGGALLAQLLPPVAPTPEHPEDPGSPGYSLVIGAVSTYRDRVAALGVGRGSRVRAVRYFSSDGGLTWH
jgi:hypothetical protein